MTQPNYRAAYLKDRARLISYGDSTRDAPFMDVPPGMPRTFENGLQQGRLMLENLQTLFQRCETGHYGETGAYVRENGMELYSLGYRFLRDMIDQTGYAQPVAGQAPLDFMTGLITGFWGGMASLIGHASVPDDAAELRRVSQHPAFRHVMSLSRAPKSASRKVSANSRGTQA
ncbi:hypothetical protein CXB49_01135 [Chromobacterium sp. ATCC 53434]|uniref:hypothetical protein n=1 Tax=Chromobacterium sp. (strain ATCC 53434 / SC 14030) TaxID=2059672 RepID=UPI000C7604C5|nr:hypothetical protein [Chromobacterium sp. ATCC 53434]AUH49540.1 hypothetical protein CXB49_01135 [Chromobacterium sp. ATCC 53434]